MPLTFFEKAALFLKFLVHLCGEVLMEPMKAVHLPGPFGPCHLKPTGLNEKQEQYSSYRCCSCALGIKVKSYEWHV